MSVTRRLQPQYGNGSGLTRAERKAEVRRIRAHSHLERVRGRQPARGRSRGLAVGAAVLGVGAGALFGVSLARGSVATGVGAARAIFVRGASRLSAEQVARATGLSPEVNPVDVATVAESLEGHAWIRDARAVRLPTGALVVGVIETVPLAVVSAGNPATRYVVDYTGTPFAPADPERDGDLPLVIVDGGAAPLEPNERVAAAVEIANDLPRYGLAPPSEVRVAAEGDSIGFTLRLGTLPMRVVLGWENIDSKLRELARLLAADVPAIGDVSELDLRFAGQAVLRVASPQTGATQAATPRGRAAPST